MKHKQLLDPPFTFYAINKREIAYYNQYLSSGMDVIVTAVCKLKMTWRFINSFIL